MGIEVAVEVVSCLGLDFFLVLIIKFIKMRYNIIENLIELEEGEEPEENPY